MIRWNVFSMKPDIASIIQWLRGSDFQFLPEIIHLLQGRHDGRFTTDVCKTWERPWNCLRCVGWKPWCPEARDSWWMDVIPMVTHDSPVMFRGRWNKNIWKKGEPPIFLVTECIIQLPFPPPREFFGYIILSILTKIPCRIWDPRFFPASSNYL